MDEEDEIIEKVSKKKMYFDEEKVKDLIVNKYQPSLIYEERDGKRVCVDRSKADKNIEKEIMENLHLIAMAIINKYRYWRFEPVEDLLEEAIKAMWYYLPNFVPGKGSVFDLFSIISKRHLLNYTLKNYKHRITDEIETCYDVSAPKDINYSLMFETLEKIFLEAIDKNFIGEKRQKYIELTSILMEYLVKNKKIINKSDLLRTFREYGYKSGEYKSFIEDMAKYKSEFYSLVK
jgi:hypothetical protein